MNPAPPVTNTIFELPFMLPRGYRGVGGWLDDARAGVSQRCVASSVVTRLYLSPPDVGPVERELLLEAFDSGWIAPLGPFVDRFEREFARVVGAPSAAAVSSGTAALHLALHMLGVGSGDDVLVPSLTFVATANAVVYAGARPCFLDSETRTWNLDAALLEQELADRARAGRLPAAVIVVDLYGQCAEWDPIVRCCEHYGVPIAEDAAEALGATYRGRAAGSFGEIGVFSFNGNKILTTSGGGMIVSARTDRVEQARHLATQARDPAPHYEHSVLGFNYRLSNLLAAVGVGQLHRLPAIIERRQAINCRYREAFAEEPGIAFMPESPDGTVTNWLTVVTLDEPAFGASPERVRTHLESLDIEARPAWKPMHLQPFFADAPMVGGAVAERVFREGLCLPSGSSMTDADVDRVIEAVLEAAPEEIAEQRGFWARGWVRGSGRTEERACCGCEPVTLVGFGPVGEVPSLPSPALRSGDCPPGGVVVEAEVEESSEVDRRGSVADADAVAFDATEPDPAVSVGDEPGDGAFDHGPVLAVVVEVRCRRASRLEPRRAGDRVL